MLKQVITASALAVLAGCGGTQSSGFTGLSAEPSAVARQQTAGGSALTGGTGYASLAGPVETVRTRARKPAKQMRDIFASPGSEAMIVQLGGQTVQLSLVEARGQRYAVFRPYDGASAVSEVVTQSFAQYARTLTGCAQAGPYYADAGATSRATALACG